MTKVSVPYLSVIIATKNRAAELRTISLPSLAKQTTWDFEVIVWDASEGDSSRRVVVDFSAAHTNLTVRFFKALRTGTCAQRNDAVKEAQGEIVFFIDDDCEVSPDGVAALREMFVKQIGLAGGCLPIDYFLLSAQIEQSTRKGRQWRTAYRTIFDPLLAGSGVFEASLPGLPNMVDNLPGCAAYRKDVFRDHLFDERLQRYAGYGLWEDVSFSHRLHQEGRILSVAERGLVVHRPAPSQRIGDPFNRGRVEGYNAGIVWKASVLPFARWSVFYFVWSRIGFLCVVLLPCLRHPWQKARWMRVAGYFAGLWTFLQEEILAFGSSPAWN